MLRADSFMEANISSDWGGYGAIQFGFKKGNLPKNSVLDAAGGHVGWFFAGTDELAFVLGALWGYSAVGTDDDEDDNFAHYGAELPILIVPDEALPVIILPFWEKATSDQENRWGSHIIVNFQDMEPLTLQLEAGAYYLNSSFGYNWMVGIGFDFW